MFYDMYAALCKSKGISLSRAADEIGLSNSTVTKWKKTGATPSGDTLTKVAAYFGVSVDDLISDDIMASMRVKAERNKRKGTGG